MISLSIPANFLSATVPRKDSAQSSEEGLKRQTRNHAPCSPSPLANWSSADIVTNDERAKPSDVTRVLSPMRPRRTPKLVKAPEVRWRLPPCLQRMPSLDSVLSWNTSASEVSTVHHAPRDVALPVSSASSAITTPPDTVPEYPPLSPSPSLSPPSPPPAHRSVRDNIVLSPSEQQLRLDTRFIEARVSDRPCVIPQLRAYQPYLLSPVTEVSSAPSIRSSITDVSIEEIGTAERRPLSDVRRQDVHIVSVSETPRVTVRDMDGLDERYSQSITKAEEASEAQERRSGIRKVLGALKKSVQGAARKLSKSVVMKRKTKVLARVL